MKRVWPLTLLVLVAGCTPAFDQSGRDWARANTGFSQITLDELDCARQMEKPRPVDTIVGGLPDLVSWGVYEARRSSGYAHCMTSKGYQRARS